MKLLRLGLLLGLLTGCDKSTTMETNATTPIIEPEVAACALPVYDLAQLRPQENQRLDSVQVARLYQQDVGLRRILESYYSEEHVYALDTVRCAGLVLLTVYHVDESGHHDLYYITLDSAGQRVQQVELVAAWGSDGGWLGKTTMQRLGRRLRVTSVDKMEDETSNDKFFTYTKDSLVVDYHLSPAGQLVLTRVDSARQIVHTRKK